MLACAALVCFCRQQLIAPGQVADCIYLISHGELEIYSPVCRSGAEALSLSEPLISGLDLAHLQEQADPDVWDTATVSDISKEPGGEAWHCPHRRQVVDAALTVPAQSARQARAMGSRNKCSLRHVVVSNTPVLKARRAVLYQDLAFKCLLAVERKTDFAEAYCAGVFQLLDSCKRLPCCTVAVFAAQAAQTS